MAHRLLHSLVFSSVIALEAAGCSTSHTAIRPPEPADGGPPDDDGGGPEHDASPWIPLADASAPEPDAGPPPRPDAGVANDAGADGGELHDLRTCEPGWPTTKAVLCEPDGSGRIVCCGLPRLLPDGGAGDECCIAPESP